MKYVVLDLEMCNTFKYIRNAYALKKEIIEIGAVILNERYDIVDTFKAYVKPKYGDIDKEIKTLTGIDRRDLVDAKAIDEVIHQFISWLPKEAVMVSWSESDLYQFMDELDEKQIYLEEMEEYYDTWIDAQDIFSEKMNVTKVYRLSEALRIAGIDLLSNEHDALCDAINTAKLFKKMQCEKTLQLSSYYMQQDARKTYNPFQELAILYDTKRN